MVDLINIGTNTGAAVSSVTVTVPIGGIPAGSTIVVCVADSSVTGTGSVTDTLANSYSSPKNAITNNGLLTNGFGSLFYAFGAKALVSGNTITYTLGHIASNAAVSAFYIPSAQQTPDPLDDLTIGTTSGSSTTPLLQAGAPATTSGELYIACVSASSGSGVTFTQDSTNAAWANFPVRVGLAGGPTIAGGSFTSNVSSATPTYAPVFGTVSNWAEFMVTFKIAQPAYNPSLQLGPTLAQ